MRNCGRHQSIRFLCMVALPLLALALRAQTAEPTDQYFNRLAREAAGAQPVRASRTPHQRAIDEALRSHLRVLIQINREFATASTKMDKEKLKQLMTPESIADPNRVADALKELQTDVQVEQEMGTRVKQTLADLRHAIETADLATAERQHMLKIFDLSMAGPDAERRQYYESEKVWAESVNDLYQFAAEHNAAIKISDGKLAVMDNAVLDQLNQKITQVNTHRQEMQTALQVYKTTQNKRLQDLGVDRKSVGLP